MLRSGLRGIPLKKIIVTVFLRLIALIGVIGVVLPVRIIGHAIIWSTAISYLRYYQIPIPISGTGSMYPTFPKSLEKDKVKQAKDVSGIRIRNMEVVVSKMETNKWLSKQETDYNDQDEVLVKEQEELATLLNTK